MFLDGVAIATAATAARSNSNNNNIPLRELFGHSVATNCDGKLILIGAPLASTKTLVSHELSETIVSSATSSSPNNRDGTGKVYLINGKNGKIIRTFVPPPPHIINTNKDGSSIYFGTSVDISCGGEYVLIGAPSPKSVPLALQNSTTTGITSGGMVYLFRTKDGKLIKAYSNPKFNPLNFDSNDKNKKRKKKKKPKRASWRKKNQNNDAVTYPPTAAPSKPDITASLNKNSDYFGVSIAIQGTKVLIGAPAHETQLANTDTHINPIHNMEDNRGCVHLFNFRGALLQTITPPKTTSLANSIASFGSSVAMNQRGQILVGAPRHDTVWLYAPGAMDILQTYTIPDNSYMADSSYVKGISNVNFGNTVSMNKIGDTIVIAAPGNIAIAGRVYVYDNRFVFTRNPKLAAKKKANGDEMPKLPGTSTTSIFGANGSNSPIHYIASPHSQTGDDFGHSLALDASGKTLVVGAPNQDTHEEDDGIAHVYDIVKSLDVNTITLAETINSHHPYSSGNFGQSVAINSMGDKVVIGSHENFDLLFANSAADTVNSTLALSRDPKHEQKHHDEVAVYCSNTKGILKWTPCSDYYAYAKWGLFFSPLNSTFHASPFGGITFLTTILSVAMLFLIYTLVVKRGVGAAAGARYGRRLQKALYDKLGCYEGVSQNDYNTGNTSHDLSFATMDSSHQPHQEQTDVELSDYNNTNASSTYEYTPPSTMMDSSVISSDTSSSSTYSDPLSSSTSSTVYSDPLSASSADTNLSSSLLG